jgi:hypothetical protein
MTISEITDRCFYKCVTIEVQLKEGDKQPEQHLDEGEHIERIVVPLDGLYEKLVGKYFLTHYYSSEVCQPSQQCQRRRARSWMPGKLNS